MANQETLGFSFRRPRSLYGFQRGLMLMIWWEWLQGSPLNLRNGGWDSDSMFHNSGSKFFLCRGSKTHVRKDRFRDEVWKAHVNEYWPWHMPNLRELGTKAAPATFFGGGQKCPFSTPIQDGGIKRLTKLPKVRHYVKAKFSSTLARKTHFETGVTIHVWPSGGALY
jgi:hypothetical protein